MPPRQCPGGGLDVRFLYIITFIGLSLSYFIARRFYKNAGHDGRRRASALAIRIATIGIAMGVAVMIVAVCVVKGFQDEVRNKLAGFTAHIEVMNPSALASPESYPITAPQAMIDELKRVEGVVSAERTVEKMGILKTTDQFQAVMLKGIGSDYDTAFIASMLIDGHLPKAADKDPTREVAISKAQADRLGLKIGSKVYAYFIAQPLRMRVFRVTGIYQTNFDQFDNTFIWTGRADVMELNDWADPQTGTIELRIDQFAHLQDVATRVKPICQKWGQQNAEAVDAVTLRENPRTASVVQWIELLDFNVRIILILMLGVAAFMMVSGLLILILERTQTIGVLKALGSTNGHIRRIFMLYAVFIIGRGLVWGYGIGLAVVWLQDWLGLVTLDSTKYYVDAVPVCFDLFWLIAIAVGTLIVCTLALVAPSLMISHIRPARAIRFE